MNLSKLRLCVTALLALIGSALPGLAQQAIFDITAVRNACTFNACNTCKPEITKAITVIKTANLKPLQTNEQLALLAAYILQAAKECPDQQRDIGASMIALANASSDTTQQAALTQLGDQISNQTLPLTDIPFNVPVAVSPN
ncbi:MAG: hypothetical protein CR993_01365 [Rhodobacterales bacterium]|nr:MAG: hypothetical protein CR993_01365 [Rhodobacterales bacterium]